MRGLPSSAMVNAARVRLNLKRGASTGLCFIPRRRKKRTRFYITFMTMSLRRLPPHPRRRPAGGAAPCPGGRPVPGGRAARGHCRVMTRAGRDATCSRPSFARRLRGGRRAHAWRVRPRKRGTCRMRAPVASCKLDGASIICRTTCHDAARATFYNAVQPHGRGRPLRKHRTFTHDATRDADPPVQHAQCAVRVPSAADAPY